MPVSLPTPEELKRIAADMNLSLTDADIASFLALMKPSIDDDNNPHNAWYVKSRIAGAPSGKLKGLRRAPRAAVGVLLGVTA